jgi:putative adhesin
MPPLPRFLVLLLAALTLTAGPSAAATPSAEPPPPAEQARGDAGGDERREFAVSRGSTLDLSNISGEVRITAGSENVIVVNAVRRGSRGASEPRLEMTQVGNRVEVRVRGSRSGNTRGSIDFTVTVPADAAVSAHSVSGDVDVSGVNGDVRIENVSGRVVAARLANLALAKSVSGDVTVNDSGSPTALALSTVSGSVVVSGLKARAVEASSVSGGIRLTGVAAERVEAKTVSGSVEFAGGLAAGGRYELTSHSGDVLVRVPATAGFDLSAESFSGRLSSDVPVTLNNSRTGPGPRALRGVAGDGGAQLVIRSFSGSVTIGRQ